MRGRPLRPRRPSAALWALAVLAALALPAGPACAQAARPPGPTGTVPATADTVPAGRAALEGIATPPLVFRPPEPERHRLHGVTVLFLEDHTLPLVDIRAGFRGGYARFGRQRYAAAMALPGLLRYGGTRHLPPDSVDVRLEFYALQTSFGTAGEGISAGLNTLTEHLETGLDLWVEMLREPRFDSSQIEVWRGARLEDVRRRADDPARLAFTEFNRLLYGDHPIGWELTARDLDPSRLNRGVLQELHSRILCRDNMVLGVTGDVTWERLRALLAPVLADWPACAEALPPPPLPHIRREPGIFVIPKSIAQSVIVLAHPTGVRLSDDPEYFNAQIANAILGGGGFSSRLLARVRTEAGYAYSASSLWTTPRRFDGIVGAVTRTRPERTVDALRLVLEILEEARTEPPTEEEVGTAVDRIVNGFVFNFETPAQIVARRMFYELSDLPTDWLERFVEGVERVTADSVFSVLRRWLHPEAMTVLVVGDPERMDVKGLEALGPVTFLEPTSSLPSEGRRFPE